VTRWATRKPTDFETEIEDAAPPEMDMVAVYKPVAHLRLWSVNKRLICSVNLKLVGQQVGWFACLRWQGAQVREQQPRCLI